MERETRSGLKWAFTGRLSNYSDYSKAVNPYGEAFKWMRRTAEQGYARAPINLGDLYVEGKGVSLDYVNAYMWYSLGSAGDPRAAIKIKEFFPSNHVQATH